MPERFACVNVADAGDTGLVKEGGLDGALHFGEDVFEDCCGEGGLKGLRAQVGFDLLNVLFCNDVNLAQGAGVFENQDTVIGEPAPEASCVGAETVVGEDVEVARHAEVDVEVFLSGELDKNVFGAAPDVENAGSVEVFEFDRLLRQDSAGALNRDGMDDGFGGSLAEAADDGVYFG